nr:hypothetical protein CFP56_66866 [Quercus suber]
MANKEVWILSPHHYTILNGIFFRTLTRGCTRQNLSPFSKSPSPSSNRNLGVPTPPESEITPPGHPSTPLRRRHWPNSTCSSPVLAARPISPSARNPLLEDQRDHSACGKGRLALGISRGNGSPLRVRKTRENLRDVRTVHDASSPPAVPVPVPRCACASQHTAENDGPVEQLTNVTGFSEETPVVTPERVQAQAQSQSMLQRHKSASRRMLSKVKSTVVGASRSQQFVREMDGVTESNGLLRRLSGRRKQFVEPHGELPTTAADIGLARDSVDSAIEPYTEGEDFTDISRNGQDIPMRSFTGSTLSSSGMPHLSPPNRRSESRTPDMNSSNSSSPDPEPTPRAGSCHSRLPSLQVAVPYVDVVVNRDCVAVDAAERKDIWVAVVATIRMNSFTFAPAALGSSCATDSRPMGTITSLRLCFKPLGECEVLDVVGQKSLKNLEVGSTCSLFIKVRLRPVESTELNDARVDCDQESLFTELESMIGMLETDLLHVEARYRHSLLPSDSVVTVRCLVKVRRPKASSRWSQIEDIVEDCGVCWVHRKMMAYFRNNYPFERAIRLIERALGRYPIDQEPAQVNQCSTARREGEMENIASRQPSSTGAGSASKPTVIVTDIDSALPSRAPLQDLSDHCSTVPSISQTTKVLQDTSAMRDIEGNSAKQNEIPEPGSPPSIRSTSLVTTNSQSEGEEDTARALWRHIRRSSLSATAQLADPAPNPLDADDRVVVELQRKAIANKRSVGAETLKAWKWERRAIGGSAVAPWL